MFDLRVPIVGTALTKPERRIIEKTGVAVTSFRIVANYRRYDRATAQWVDYGLFRIRVSCWRRLADHVFKSIDVGDPVMVIGRIWAAPAPTRSSDSSSSVPGSSVPGSGAVMSTSRSIAIASAAASAATSES